MNTISARPPYRQRGISTLLIALLLLAILTVVTIFATSFGMFEQRTSGNEYRHKLAFQAAEAGLNQAVEYAKANTRTMLSTASGGWFFPGAERWQPCSAAAPAGMLVDPCLAEPNTARRNRMYRYVGTTSGVLPLSEMLGGVNQTFTTTGGDSSFATTYQAYAALCRLDLSGATPECSLAPASEGTFYVTLVGRGALSDEKSTALVKQSYGTFRLLGNAPAAPLIAAGVAVGLGNAQIVPNPDAAGFGVPVSIWAKGNATIDQASFATCQKGEWLANAGTPAPSAQDLINGVCASCTCNGLCPGFGLLSGNAKSCPIAKDMLEGEDVLDVDSNFSDATPKVRDSKYFPPDLFAYIFGVPSSSADSYLTVNAKPLTDCGTLTSASSGLYWYKGASECALKNSIGTLQDPVVLVSDAKVSMAANSQYYGIIYVRSKAGTGDLFKASGTPQVYGSVILEGDANMSGSPTIVYNKAVLQNIFNSPNFVRYGSIPGSWSDSPLN